MGKIKKTYGYPYKSHGQWSNLVKTEKDEIKEIRFNSPQGAKKFNEKYKDRK